MTTDERDQVAKVVTDLLTVIGYLMPGLKNISVPDYEIVNTAQVNARKFLVDVNAGE